MSSSVSTFTWKKKLLVYAFYLLLSLPVWMYLAWLVSPKRPVAILILDKTVLTSEGREHRSFNWILTHDKFVRPDHGFYEIEKDYYGFFPGKDEKYTLRDFQGMSAAQLAQVARAHDMAYVTDSYGIYHNEWYLHKNETEHSKKVYGGLDWKDLALLQQMRAQGKLILTEFNFIATPTPPDIRQAAEATFGIRWTGWAGRHFDSLDPVKNKELPQWVTGLYTRQYKKPWAFTKSGLVFVHMDERIVVLENETHLEYEVPLIETLDEPRRRLGLPKKMTYPYWFDITYPTAGNQAIAHYVLQPNEAGKRLLQKFSLPVRFPAVIENPSTRLFYYFAGDWADNPIKNYLAYFKGITWFSAFFYNPNDLSSREGFFWDYYIPMITHILQDYSPGKRPR